MFIESYKAATHLKNVTLLFMTSYSCEICTKKHTPELLTKFLLIHRAEKKVCSFDTLLIQTVLRFERNRAVSIAVKNSP